MKWLYLAGPYTHPDPVVNTRNTIIAADSIKMCCPAVHPIVPHLSHLWHLVEPHDLDYWYEYDLELLSRCDGLLRLPGESTGADREVAAAVATAMRVFRTDDRGHLPIPRLNEWAS